MTRVIRYAAYSGENIFTDHIIMGYFTSTFHRRSHGSFYIQTYFTGRIMPRNSALVDIRVCRRQTTSQYLNIFKCISSNENVRISIDISLKFVPMGPVNNIPALVPIMAWRRPGAKPLSETMLVYWRIYTSLGINDSKLKIYPLNICTMKGT